MWWESSPESRVWKQKRGRWERGSAERGDEAEEGGTTYHNRNASPTEPITTQKLCRSSKGPIQNIIKNVLRRCIKNVQRMGNMFLED